MKIRKIQYNIFYSHILTFCNDYKKIVAPYFGWDNVQYSIENINTINEGVRLILPDFCSIIQCRKDGISLMYEGDIGTLIGDEGIIHDFYNIYEKITHLECYSKTNRHDLIVYGVDTTRSASLDEYIKINPIKDSMIDFACTYHFDWKKHDINVTIGNFIHEDVTKYDLSPFKSKFNEDLFSSKDGKVCEVRISYKDTSPNFIKFKSLINTAEHNLKIF